MQGRWKEGGRARRGGAAGDARDGGAAPAARAGEGAALRGEARGRRRGELEQAMEPPWPRGTRHGRRRQRRPAGAGGVAAAGAAARGTSLASPPSRYLTGERREERGRRKERERRERMDDKWAPLQRGVHISETGHQNIPMVKNE